VLVTYEGSGHFVYSRTAFTRAAADTYFAALTLPAPDTRCTGNDPALAHTPATAASEAPPAVSAIRGPAQQGIGR
jgi:hypothetical protein